jgi:hypothetical protein
MAGVARTTGIGHAHALIYSTANLGFYVIDCKADMSGEGGIGKALEAVAQAINPLAFDSEGSAGLINVVVDGSQWDAAALTSAVSHLGTDVGSTGSINFTTADATEGGQFIVT